MVQKLFSNKVDEMKRVLSGFVIISMMSITLISCIDKEKRKSTDDPKKVKNATSSQNEYTYELGKDWKLAWSDEFEINGAPDPTNWTYDLGDGGWGNGEVQTYTNDSENVIVEEGFLKITAKTDGAGGYTSARIKSENLKEYTYGKVEVSAKLPSATGTWPAIWALGANFDVEGWPTCGEIDIMEQTGADKNKVLSTLHFPGNSGGGGITNSTTVSTATSEFHIYTAAWTADTIEFWVDDNPVHNTFINNTNTPFNNDFFFIMNVAMGGSLGGTIDSSFTEDTMEIDYIRVYQ